MTGVPPPGDQKLPDRQYYIALIFIILFGGVLAIALANYWWTGSSSMATFVGTLFGGWVGAIIGFYFGQKPTEQLQNQLATQRQDFLTERQGFTQKWDELFARIPKQP